MSLCKRIRVDVSSSAVQDVVRKSEAFFTSDKRRKTVHSAAAQNCQSTWKATSSTEWEALEMLLNCQNSGDFIAAAASLKRSLADFELFSTELMHFLDVSIRSGDVSIELCLQLARVAIIPFASCMSMLFSLPSFTSDFYALWSTTKYVEDCMDSEPLFDFVVSNLILLSNQPTTELVHTDRSLDMFSMELVHTDRSLDMFSMGRLCEVLVATCMPEVAMTVDVFRVLRNDLPASTLTPFVQFVMEQFILKQTDASQSLLLQARSFLAPVSTESSSLFRVRESLCLELVRMLPATDVLLLIERGLCVKQLNWEMVLFVSSAWIHFNSHESTQFLVLLDKYLIQAVELNDTHLLGCCVVLARSMNRYEDWFRSGFIDPRVAENVAEVFPLCGHKRTCRFALLSLTSMVPDETVEYLRIHIKGLSKLTKKCRLMAEEYMVIAKTRLVDLGSSADVEIPKLKSTPSALNTVPLNLPVAGIESDVIRAVEQYVQTNRLPLFLNEARMFRKPWWQQTFLPALLDPSKAIDVDLKGRQSLIESLLNQHVISEAQFAEFCKAVEAVKSAPVVPDISINSSLLRGTPLEQAESLLNRLALQIAPQASASSTVFGEISNHLQSVQTDSNPHISYISAALDVLGAVLHRFLTAPSSLLSSSTPSRWAWCHDYVSHVVLAPELSSSFLRGYLLSVLESTCSLDESQLLTLCFFLASLSISNCDLYHTVLNSLSHGSTLQFLELCRLYSILIRCLCLMFSEISTEPLPTSKRGYLPVPVVHRVMWMSDRLEFANTHATTLDERLSIHYELLNRSMNHPSIVSLIAAAGAPDSTSWINYELSCRSSFLPGPLLQSFLRSRLVTLDMDQETGSSRFDMASQLLIQLVESFRADRAAGYLIESEPIISAAMKAVLTDLFTSVQNQIDDESMLDSVLSRAAQSAPTDSFETVQWVLDTFQSYIQKISGDLHLRTVDAFFSVVAAVHPALLFLNGKGQITRSTMTRFQSFVQSKELTSAIPWSLTVVSCIFDSLREVSDSRELSGIGSSDIIAIVESTPELVYHCSLYWATLSPWFKPRITFSFVQEFCSAVELPSLAEDVKELNRNRLDRLRALQSKHVDAKMLAKLYIDRFLRHVLSNKSDEPLVSSLAQTVVSVETELGWFELSCGMFEFGVLAWAQLLTGCTRLAGSNVTQITANRCVAALKRLCARIFTDIISVPWFVFQPDNSFRTQPLKKWSGLDSFPDREIALVLYTIIAELGPEIVALTARKSQVNELVESATVCFETLRSSPPITKPGSQTWPTIRVLNQVLEALKRRADQVTV